MSAHCQVTGKQPSFGKTVSHSHRRHSRRWNPNVQKRRFYLPSEGRTITLKKYDPVVRKHVEFREER